MKQHRNPQSNGEGLLRRLSRLLSRKESVSLLFLLVLTLFSVVLESLGLGAVFVAVGAMIGGQSSRVRAVSPPFMGDLSGTSGLVVIMAVLIGVFVFKNMLALSLTWFQHGVLSQLSARLGHRLFETYLRKSYSFHLTNSSPSLIVKTQNANLLSNGLIGPILTLTTDALVGISLVIVMFIVEPFSTLVVVALFLVFGSLFNRQVSRYSALWGAEQVDWRTLSVRQMQESYGAVKEIRVMGREQSSVNDYRMSLQKLARLNQLFLTTLSIPRAGLEILSLLAIAILVIGQSARGYGGDRILPVLALFAAGAIRIAPSVNRVLTAIQQVQVSLPALAGIIEDLEKGPSRSVSSPQSGSFQFEALDFQSVWFQYEGSSTETISNLSLHVTRGDSLGIVGKSGVGKTTLVDLALGLLEPTRGQVLLNGHKLETVTEIWRRNLGYVPQNVFLSDASIRQNIGFGLPSEEIDDDLVWLAIRRARLESFVHALPDGLNTTVGERGVRLSGGERQRIGIARALYTKPQVLFLDEATSSLDASTEAAFLDEIEGLKEHATVVFVTHRESALRVCERVVELRK